MSKKDLLHDWNVKNWNPSPDCTSSSDQSYKHFTLVNYDSRVAITSKLHIFTTLELYFTLVEAL